MRAISLEIAKAYKGYTNVYDHKTFQEVNLAIEKLERLGLIRAEKTSRGFFEKVRLVFAKVDEAYLHVNRLKISVENCKMLSRHT